MTDAEKTFSASKVSANKQKKERSKTNYGGLLLRGGVWHMRKVIKGVIVSQQAAKLTQLKLELQVARKGDDAARVRDLEVAVAVAGATLAAFERSLASVK